jgi:hypothetical protein
MQRIEAAITPALRPWPTARHVTEILRGALALVHDEADLSLLVAEVLRAEWDPAITTLFYNGDKHVRESKLQVFIKEKLVASLRNVSPPVEVKLIREPNESVGEPDFLVIAKVSRGFLAVPIEVKWSDNDPVGGLEEQLGTRYLGNARRTHGVFVVGWTGKPQKPHLKQTLCEARLRQANQGRTIHVVCKELRKPTPRPKPRARSSARHRRPG